MTAPLQELAAFVARTSLSDIPTDVVARGRLMLADCVGCIVAGNAAPPVRRLLALEQARDGAQRATVFGTKVRLPAESAAFVNGTAGTWHDLDEGNLHTRGHAMIQIVPAAFAEAEAGGQSGEALLEASILAYEAASRIWRATKVRLAVHPHGTFGPMAAAFAISKLRGDSAEQMAEAVAIAAGLGVVASRQTLGDGATVRNVYTGHSSRAGFLAMDLRDAGFTGEDDAARSVFGGIYGDGFDPTTALDRLDQVWWLRKSYFKRFASARYVHGALDAIEALIARLGPRLTPDTIERIDIATYFMAATMAQQTVRTTFGTRFSIPFAAASLIARGAEPLTDDGAAAFADPAAHALAARVFVTEDLELTASYPAKQPAVVTVRLTDGSVETHTAEIILGESDNPFAPHVLQEKFMALTGNASAAWNRLAHIEMEPNLLRLAADLQGVSAT